MNSIRSAALLLVLSIVGVSTTNAQTTYTWTGGSGSWFVENNWSPAGIPGAIDTAIVEVGTPELTQETTVASVDFSGAALTGDGNLTVTDTFNWFAGNLDGRNFAETAALTIAQDATLHITGDETKGLRGRDIFVEGSMIWEGTGNLVVMWGTLLEIGSDAEFDIRTDATITRTNGTLDIENNGLIVKSEGSGTTAFNYPYGGFHNLGSVRVEIGTLMLNNANSSFNASGDGDFEIVSGATLRFNQAEYDFDEGSAVSGEGTLLVTSGVVELGAGELSGPVHVSAGILRFIDTNTATELADVTISGGDLSGEAMKNINGLLTWTGGRLGFGGGVLNFRGGVSAEGDEDKVLGGGTYNNSSTFSWTGAGRLVVNRGGTFNNLEGAVFDIQNDVSLTRTNGILDFVNSGLIRKSAGSGATTIAHPFGVFNNDGEVRVESGTLYVRNQEESTDTGTWIVEEGARLHFNLHERTFTETASLIGTGALQISDGATILNHGTIAPGLSIGTLHIEGNLPASQPDGALEIELGGTEAGVDHDVLVASNIANLGGRLRLVLVDDFEPTGDEVFTIVQALAVVGEFDEVEAPEGFVAEVVYGAQEVTAQLLPVTTCSDGLQPDEHTLALYKFDEPLAGTSFDASDNQLHAIDDGTTVTEGRFCGARRFDGESDRIDIDVVRDSLQGTTAWTIEYIARSIDGGGVPELVNHSCGNGWWLGPRSNDVRFSIKTTAAGSCLWTVDEAFAEAAIDTLWHYYAMTWDGDSLRVYRDGTFLDGRPGGGVFLQTQTSSFRAWIGYSDSASGSYTGGIADELRVSSTARSDAELLGIASDLGFTESSVATDDEIVPGEFALHAPYPNPAGGDISLSFDLPHPTSIRLAVYDVLGRSVSKMIDDVRPAGRHEIVLDGRRLASGVYFVRLEAGGVAATRQIIVAD